MKKKTLTVLRSTGASNKASTSKSSAIIFYYLFVTKRVLLSNFVGQFRFKKNVLKQNCMKMQQSNRKMQTKH